MIEFIHIQVPKNRKQEIKMGKNKSKTGKKY